MKARYLTVVVIALLVAMLAAGCQTTTEAEPATSAQEAETAETGGEETTDPGAIAVEEPAEEAEEPAEEAEAAAGDPVTIGILTPLSPPGDVAAGQLIQRGAELGARYVNEEMGGVLDGRPVELAIEDDQGTPETGVAGYRRLVTQLGAVAVTGQFHSSVNLAVNEVAKELGVPVIATQASAGDITGLGYDIAFRTHAIDPVRAEAWIAFIEERGFQRVAIIAEDTDYGIGLVEAMETQVEGTDVELNSVVFNRGTPDITPQLLQIKDWGPDLVINIGVGEAAHLIINQAYTIDLFPEVPMLASYDFPVRPEFWELHSENGNDLYFISYFHPQQQLTELGQWFTAVYEEEYGEPAVYSAYSAFGDVVIIAQAVEQAGRDDPADIVEALETGEFENWTGTATFPQEEGIFWHQWTPPLLILHYTEAGQSFRDAELVFEYVR